MFDIVEAANAWSSVPPGRRAFVSCDIRDEMGKGVNPRGDWHEYEILIQQL
jgi:hypothetical protein